jgi:hypothetical protein
LPHLPIILQTQQFFKKNAATDRCILPAFVFCLSMRLAEETAFVAQELFNVQNQRSYV